MTIELSDATARFLDEQVKAGRYPSAGAAVDAAVERLRAALAEAEDQDELRELAKVGMAEVDRGEFVEFTAEDVIAERRAAWAERQGRA